jgi:hypothetical protein
MDAERSIAEIEWLEHIFVVPDTRPLSASDLLYATSTAVKNVAVAGQKQSDTWMHSDLTLQCSQR